MKRIMFYNRSFFGGGVEKALADLIVKLDPEKYDITVIVQDREGKYLPLYEEIEKTHSNIHIHQCFEHLTDGKNIFHKAYNVLTLKIAKWSMLRFPKLYYRLAIRGKWDVEISYMHNEAVKIIAGSSNKRSKKYTYVHTDISVHTGWTGYFKSQKERVKYYKKYDGIICVSDKVKNSVNKILGPFDNIQTIYNLVDRDNIIQKSKEPLGFEVDKSVSIICAVGRLSFEKNFEHLIKHFIKLKRGGYAVNLWIVGEGPDKEMLSRLISDNNADDYITLFGYQTNPYKFMKNCDFTVCSSLYEGLHIASMESIVLGKPVVSNLSVVTEFFGGKKCGVITDNNDEAFFDGLKQMLSNPQLLRECTLNAEEQSKIDINTENIVKLEKLLDS